jgi:hypothetical protein
MRREPNIKKCRNAAIVLGEVMSKHGLNNDEITKAVFFMDEPNRKYLKIVERQDGRAVLLSEAGMVMLGMIKLERIEEEKAATARQKADKERRQDVRLKQYAIIVSILAIILTLVYTIWK